MSENKTQEKQESKLQVIIGKESKQIIPPNKEPLRLLPLNLIDISDMEEEFGPIENALDDITIKKMLYLLWLSVRKNGITDEQLFNAEWKYSLREVGSWFDFSDFKKVMEAINAILEISGFKTKKTKDKPGGAPKNAETPLGEKSPGGNTVTTSAPNSSEPKEKSA